MIVLREYQEQILERVEAAEARGVRKQLVVAATGLGKSLVFTALARRRGGRALILAHRDELVNQAVATIRGWWPEIDVGIVKGTENDVRHHVVVASVQTLSRSRRMLELLAPFDPNGMTLLGRAEPFDLVICDEAHHVLADSWRFILDAVHAGEPDGPLLVGVTATPDRGDGKGLGDVFEEIVATYDLLWGILNGYLCEIRGLRVKVKKLDLDKVKVSKGDYDQGQAGRALRDAGAEHVIYKAWAEHAPDRRTLVFTPTVETAQLVANEFAANGVAAAMVHAKTPQDERRQMLRDYAAGTIQVLANVGVLTEGFDAPRTDCVVISRPTKSRALFTQMVGRGTRLHPEKSDLLVLDVTGVSETLSLVTVPSLFGLSGEWAESMGNGGGLITSAVVGHQQEQIRLGEIKAAEVDLFHKVRAAGIAWITVPRKEALTYVRPLPPVEKGGPHQPTVILVQRNADEWTAGLIHPDGKQSTLIGRVSMETAQGVAEDFVRSHAPRSMTDTDAEWRSRRPTPGLVAMARKWHVPIDKSWNMGELSDRLNARIAASKLRTPKNRTKAKDPVA